MIKSSIVLSRLQDLLIVKSVKVRQLSVTVYLMKNTQTAVNLVEPV